MSVCESDIVKTMQPSRNSADRQVLTRSSPFQNSKMQGLRAPLEQRSSKWADESVARL